MAIRLESVVLDSSSSNSNSKVEGKIISINTTKRYKPYSRKSKEDLERKAIEEKKLPSIENIKVGIYIERNARDKIGIKI